MHINYKRPWITPYQRKLLDSGARFTVCEAATKCGKTASHIIWLFEQGLKCKVNQSVWWVAPTYSQAEIAYRRMKNQVSNKNFFKANETKLLLILPTGARIEFKSAEKPDNLYGDDVYAAVFDEFTRAREEAWFALRSTLTATGGKCKLIGNARGKKNWGYRLGLKAKSGEPGYEYHKITAFDAVEANVPGITLDEILQAKRDLPEYVFNELYLAEPAEDGANPFGIANIAARIKPLSQLPPVAFGIDLAKYSDWTAIVGLDLNGDICYFDRFQMDWKQTKQTIINTIKQIPTLIDSTGVGDPIVEDITRICFQARGYKYSFQTKQQLMEGLASAVQEGKVSILDGAMRDEMEQFEFEYNKGRVSYNAPSGVHDDCVNALALAYECKTKHPQPLKFWN